MRILGTGLLSALLAFALGGALVFPPEIRGASAASIFVGPSSGTFTIGSTFTVSIYLNTGGQFVNAVEANLSFPPDKLQVVSPTAGTSLVRVWVSQPTYSNVDGTLRFQGAIPSPGISTESGLISTVTFRVKSVGTAVVKVLDTSRVLLNDGKGTDILGERSGGIYNLVLPPPAGPIVTSPTNPDQEKWYNTRNVALRWEGTADVQGFSYILNVVPVDDPDDISEGLRTSVRYSDLPDGIHYFHVKALRGGVWGGVTSYAIKIDATPPAAFPVVFSPGARTSNRRPVISFETTDAVSGLDHYELKLIPLDLTLRGGKSISRRETPFFIEAVSPYSEELELGRYDVIILAYDKAGNFYQASEHLTVTTPVFEFIRASGLRFSGTYTVSWLYIWLTAGLVLIILAFFGSMAWRLHRRASHHLERGSINHPDVQEKLRVLEEKQKEYGGGSKKFLTLLILGLLAGSLLFGNTAFSALENPITVEPPVITLFPKLLSNDEIFYIGGRAGAPNAEIIIYLQETESGRTLSYIATTDKTGAWFYTLPTFLAAGHYVAWTQLKVGEEQSPPSPQLELIVASTAFQVGEKRISFERLYFLIAVAFGIALLVLIAFILYHGYHARAKGQRLIRELKAVEDAIHRGFAVLRRDIEAELGVIHKVKLSKEISLEERAREDKLLRDLDTIDNYVGKEFWEIDREL